MWNFFILFISDDLEEVPYIMNYLDSVNYIDEFQKFMEDRNYKYDMCVIGFY